MIDLQAARLGSIHWSSNYLSDPDNVIIDLETTGVGDGSEPVQLTVINVEGKPLMNTYLKPTVPIEAGAQAVHNISAEMVRNAPRFVQILPELRRITSGQIVVAYNLDFDRRIIRQTCARYNVQPPGAAGFDCAMLRFGAFYGEFKKGSQSVFKWHKLSAACELMGINRDGFHEAAADCLATLELIQTMATAKP